MRTPITLAALVVALAIGATGGATAAGSGSPNAKTVTKTYQSSARVQSGGTDTVNVRCPRGWSAVNGGHQAYSGFEAGITAPVSFAAAPTGSPANAQTWGVIIGPPIALQQPFTAHLWVSCVR